MSCLRTKAAIEAGHPEWAELPASSHAAWECGSTQYFSGKVCPQGHIAPRSRSGGGCSTCYYQYRTSPKNLARIKSPDFCERERARRKNPAYQEYNRKYLRTPSQQKYSTAYAARRRAVKLKATPPWLTDSDKAAMRALYDEAARLTEVTGIPHHVDHIVPLRATCPITRQRNACGLHIPANLQVIPATDNLSKNCYFNGGWS